MKLKFITEKIEKQSDISYKGWTIVHFPVTWYYGGAERDIDGWIIQSPYRLEGNHYLPLYCEDEYGEVINFETAAECKEYIDKYIEPKKGKIVCKHRNECHYELLEKESIEEKVEIHNHLNPKIWDNEQKLLPEVRSKIIEIVELFKKQLEEYEVELKIDDVYIVGSNANFNYNEHSDLDLHLIADESIDCIKKHLPVIYQVYKTLFNKKYEITIRGINVELYVENKEQLSHVSNGVYSLKDGWLKKPANTEIPEIDELTLAKKVQHWENRYLELTTDATVDKIDAYINDIYALRQESINTEGEFGLGNLTFKEIRNLGYLDELKELKNELIGRELSLESLDKNA